MASLVDCVGEWVGTNGFRLMPADPLAIGPARATVTVAAGAHLTSMAYRWEHPQDGAQEGLIVFGEGAAAGTVVGLWGDSWHQQPQPMSMSGQVAEQSIQLEGEYGGGWRWSIVLDPASSDLRMRMENVVPADQATVEEPAGPYDVMVMDLRRS
jgi:hypothetical protein